MTTTPDYNDGNVHAWSGGECPIDRKSVIDASLGDKWVYWVQAGKILWSQTLLFRVIDQHIEPPKPMEMWVNVYADGLYGNPRATEEEAVTAISGNARTVHMREVTE